MIWYDMIWYDMICVFWFRHDFGELWICWWWYALAMFTFIQGVFFYKDRLCMKSESSLVHWKKRIQPQLPYENILTCLWCIPVVLLMQLRQITVTITVSPIVFVTDLWRTCTTSHSHDLKNSTLRKLHLDINQQTKTASKTQFCQPFLMSSIGECPSQFRYFKYLRLFFESMDALPKQKRKLWRGLSVDLHKNPQCPHQRKFAQKHVATGHCGATFDEGIWPCFCFRGWLTFFRAIT